MFNDLDWDTNNLIEKENEFTNRLIDSQILLLRGYDIFYQSWSISVKLLRVKSREFQPEINSKSRTDRLIDKSRPQSTISSVTHHTR